MTTNSRFLPALRALGLALALALGMSGCVHRIGIMQGNFLDREDLDRVAVGMTRVQVRALLGTPMISDPFHQERWDYMLYMKMGRWKHSTQQHFTVYFDEQDKVARIDKPSTPMPSIDEEREVDPSEVEPSVEKTAEASD